MESYENPKLCKTVNFEYWKAVKQGLKESDGINTNFENFKRGQKFEIEGISVFCMQFV